MKIQNILTKIGYSEKGIAILLGRRSPRSAYFRELDTLLEQGVPPTTAVERVLELVEKDYKAGKLKYHNYYFIKKKLQSLRDVLSRESGVTDENEIKAILFDVMVYLFESRKDLKIVDVLRIVTKSEKVAESVKDWLLRNRKYLNVIVFYKNALKNSQKYK